jgi:hypothetical protein
MTHRSVQIAAFLALVLSASTLFPGCSKDASVESGPLDPFKDLSCFDFASYLHAVSVEETPGLALAVDLTGGFAYVADAGNGLQVVDYRVPSSPIVRGSVGAPQPALDVVAADGIVCLSVGAAGVAVVDAGDPDRPAIVGGVDTPGSTAGITLRDTIVYVTDDIAGLMLIDIGEPDAPFITGVDNSPGQALDVAVDGAFAYVADRHRGLKVVNVNDPTDPWWVGDVPLSSGGRGVVLSDGFAFVAAGSGGLQIVDIVTPGAEVVVGSLATRGDASVVAIDPAADVAFVAQGWWGVDVVDVSDPHAPVLINTLVNSSEALGISTERGVTVIAERGDGLLALNTASPRPPPVTATLPGEVSHVISRSGAVFAAGPGTGLFGVEKGASTLSTSGTLALLYEVVDLFVHGDTAFVASKDGRIEMVNINDPAAMDHVGWVPFQGSVVSLGATGELLCFVGGRSLGIWVPGAPDVTTVDVSSTSSTVEVTDDYAYVGSVTGAVRTVNIQDPGRPMVVSVASIEGGASDIIAADGKLIILTYSINSTTTNGVAVYDLPMPMLLASEGFVRLSDRPRRAALSGAFLYVAVGGGGMAVVDLSDPSNPRLIGTVPSGDASSAAAVAGGSVFVADGAGGLFTVRAQGCVPAP